MLVESRVGSSLDRALQPLPRRSRSRSWLFPHSDTRLWLAELAGRKAWKTLTSSYRYARFQVVRPSSTTTAQFAALRTSPFLFRTSIVSVWLTHTFESVAFVLVEGPVKIEVELLTEQCDVIIILNENISKRKIKINNSCTLANSRLFRWFHNWRTRGERMKAYLWRSYTIQ